MDAINGRGPTTNSSVESEAVRRRDDLDSSFKGSSVQQVDQQSPVPQATDAGNEVCGEFVESPLTTQQDRDTNVVSKGSEDTDNLAETNTSKEKTEADKCRTTAALSSAPDAAGGGEREKDAVVSETSENFQESRRTNASERDSGGTSEIKVSLISDSAKGSGTVAPKLSSPFGGSCSLVEVTNAYERASEALKQERRREDNVVAVAAEGETKVSKLTYMFDRVATVPLAEFVTEIENRDLRADGCSDAFEERFDVIKAYVNGLCPETGTQENSKTPVVQVHGNRTASDTANLMGDPTKVEDQKIRTTRGHVDDYIVDQASSSVLKSWNVVVLQRELISKQCAVAEKLVSKAEVSCQLIFHCLKSVVIVLTPAVRVCMLIEVVLGKLCSGGPYLPAFLSAYSAVAKCTSEALMIAEGTIRIHKNACQALHVVTSDLLVMRGYQRAGARVFSDITAAGDRLLDLVRQLSFSLSEMRNRESKMKTMTRFLTPPLKNMRTYVILMEQWSALCSDTLSVILLGLSSATENSCDAIEEATKAVERVLIPAALSFNEQPK